MPHLLREEANINNQVSTLNLKLFNLFYEKIVILNEEINKIENLNRTVVGGEFKCRLGVEMKKKKKEQI